MPWGSPRKFKKMVNKDEKPDNPLRIKEVQW
jgi:hypothetical protein